MSMMPPKTAGHLIEAAMVLAGRRSLPASPTGGHFRGLSREILELAQLTDKVIHDLIRDAAESTSVDLPILDDVLVAGLGSEDLFDKLELAAKAADEIHSDAAQKAMRAEHQARIRRGA